MRVIFMGTPDFARASLERLLLDGFEVCAVYTQPDRASGRGMRTSASPVKELALQKGLPVLQPESFQDPDVIAELLRFRADVIAVVAYGRLLPQAVLDACPLGAVNLHGSLLPKYRGAAPIQWAVLNGDRETGVCTFHLVPRMDAGDLIYSASTPIGEDETSGELYDRLATLGASLLSKTLTDLGLGTAPRTPQAEENATYVSRLSREMSPIDFSRTSREIRKWICGLQPWPVATMDLGGETVRVFAAEDTDLHTDAAPGTVLEASPRTGLVIACGGGAVRITELQAPGKKRMAATDYLRGHPLPPSALS